MNAVLNNFKVTPSVVKADCENEITIKSIDGVFGFYDDITYDVEFIPQDESDVPMDKELSLKGYDKSRKTFKVKPENGELRLKYFFKGEQEWKIHISSSEYESHQNPLYEKYRPYWNHLIDYPKNGVRLSVYSLYEDLYERIPLRGDLHIHTYASDGEESPENVAAAYRKAGRDFIAITDHNVFNTSEKAADMLSFADGFKIMHGEEAHNGIAGYFHMVNIGGSYSVNEIYLNNPEKAEREACELEGTVEIPENVDKREYLRRVWLYGEIKKSGGYAIYPHPYWNIGYFHTPTNMSRAIIKNGLCDAFEVLGGCTPEELNMQVALYNDLRAEGCDIPIVGSTDSHTVLADKHIKYSTLAFAKNDEILKSISEHYSVAVEAVPNESVRAYGKLRLVMYTHFLIKNYFPTHDRLCSVSGELMLAYVHGEKELKEDILRAEERIKTFKKEFFGR